MMPRLAALSMAEIIACTSFASGLAPAAETPFCIPRRRLRTLRLRRARLMVWRARLEADRVLAMVKICEAGRVAESSGPVKARSASREISAREKLCAAAEVRLLLQILADGPRRFLHRLFRGSCRLVRDRFRLGRRRGRRRLQSEDRASRGFRD